MRTVTLTLACLAAGTLATTGAGLAHAATVRTTNTMPLLSATARQHGLTTAGGAVAGWMNRTVKTTAFSTGAGAAPAAVTRAPAVLGQDFSGYSGTINAASFAKAGSKFAYVKATEGTYYKSAPYTQQVASLRKVGIITAPYHFANPAYSSAVSQADYFAATTGKWKPGQLPGMVDMEYNPYGSNSCYGLTQAQMGAWVTSFQKEYKAKTGTYPVIYTTTNWWNTCVGNGSTSAVIALRSPLWVAIYNSSIASPALPQVWNGWTIWQTDAVTKGSYDNDRFQGSLAMLLAFAAVGAQ